ncbi:hypothetical protein CLPUN_14400 [Clostridium puniceum]|uniref:Uncharacterized protein n=1 Tax=Clostridium puniceum TaxID=29367 RepID=A0A1S8TPS6_9CLOT|nr:hypothetical protein [Clostridium puniceum]OOM79761.1 hypothetical protein CLPUN_14400 [Clostridium puniceum]
MSDYSMDISGRIGLSDYSNIFDYLNIIEKDDNFIIKIDKNNRGDIDMINSMLQDNKFIINYTQYDDFGNYYISANKASLKK